MSDLSLSLIFRVIDQATRPISKIGASVKKFNRASGLDRVSADALRAGKSIGNLAGEAGRFAGKMALLGGGIGYLFKTQLIDTASEFENFAAVLKVVEGSSAGAEKALDWVSDFAATTPFNLDKVTEAYVQLRSYGLDPTNGLLRTLGDTASAMNKPLSMAVEAIADAVTGENERLKEFGIVARAVGDKLVYEYTINGEQMRKVAKKNNRQQIQDTLAAIWNEKYAGAMDEMSRTWQGMVSNLEDQWMRFKVKIMKAGAFDFLKGKLDALLNTVNSMAASGELQKLASDMGERLVNGLRRLWEVGGAVITVMSSVGAALSWAANLLGGWENLGIVMVGLWGGKVVLALLQAIMALKTLGLTLMATPFGWFLAAAAAIATAAYLIWKNWDWVAGKLDDIWNGMKSAVQLLKVMFLSVVSVIGDAVAGMINILPDSLKTTLHLDGAAQIAADINSLRDEAGLNLKAMGTGAQASRTQGNPLHAGGAPRSQVDVSLKIDSEGRPQIREMKTSSRDVNIDVDAGMVMVGG